MSLKIGESIADRGLGEALLFFLSHFSPSGTDFCCVA